MKLRFPLFILFLLLSLGMAVYGLVGHTVTLYEQPAPEDEGPVLPEGLDFIVGEIVLTDWTRGERVEFDDYGRLIDTAQEAECFS